MYGCVHICVQLHTLSLFTGQVLMGKSIEIYPQVILGYQRLFLQQQDLPVCWVSGECMLLWSEFGGF